VLIISGRVDQLFAAAGVQQWGSFNFETNIELKSSSRSSDEDLLETAAIQNNFEWGTVYAGARKVLDDAPLAAVFRAIE